LRILRIRYCAEVEVYITFISDSAHFKYGENYMECMNISPTRVLHSNYGMERVPQSSDYKFVRRMKNSG